MLFFWLRVGLECWTLSSRLSTNEIKGWMMAGQLLILILTQTGGKKKEREYRNQSSLRTSTTSNGSISLVCTLGVGEGRAGDKADRGGGRLRIAA